MKLSVISSWIIHLIACIVWGFYRIGLTFKVFEEYNHWGHILSDLLIAWAFLLLSGKCISMALSDWRKP